jgi:hypothetical protein
MVSYQSEKPDASMLKAVVRTGHITIRWETHPNHAFFKNCFQLRVILIKVFNPNDALLPTGRSHHSTPKNAAGKYYCPMFCEDDKV